MLYTSARGRELGALGWSLEPKLDGWRALVNVDGEVTVRARNGRVVASGLAKLSGHAVSS